MDAKENHMNISCAILAGGRSRRMGRDKATIKLDNKPLIRHVYDQVREIFRDVVIVSSYHKSIEGIDAPFIGDVMPVQSPLTGITSALLHAANPYTFVIACDMPFVSRTAMEYMRAEMGGEDIIIPKVEKGYEPLHAIYNRSCISLFLTFIERNRLKIPDAFAFLSVRELEERRYFINNGRSIFTNVNTEEDLNIIKAARKE
jgi:molybdenum cofactor guanylyltransferase